MSLFQASIVVPPNTPRSVPYLTEIRPTVGYINRISVMFPDGCLGAVGFRLSDGGKQFAPLPAGWLGGRNNETLEWVEGRQLEGPPYVITVESYNLAVDWPHTLYFTLEIIR
jgi:hypothetical protein